MKHNIILTIGVTRPVPARYLLSYTVNLAFVLQTILNYTMMETDTHRHILTLSSWAHFVRFIVYCSSFAGCKFHSKHVYLPITEFEVLNNSYGPETQPS